MRAIRRALRTKKEPPLAGAELALRAAPAFYRNPSLARLELLRLSLRRTRQQPPASLAAQGCDLACSGAQPPDYTTAVKPRAAPPAVEQKRRSASPAVVAARLTVKGIDSRGFYRAAARVLASRPRGRGDRWRGQCGSVCLVGTLRGGSPQLPPPSQKSIDFCGVGLPSAGFALAAAPLGLGGRSPPLAGLGASAPPSAGAVGFRAWLLFCPVRRLEASPQSPPALFPLGERGSTQPVAPLRRGREIPSVCLRSSEHPRFLPRGFRIAAYAPHFAASLTRATLTAKKTMRSRKSGLRIKCIVRDRTAPRPLPRQPQAILPRIE